MNDQATRRLLVVDDEPSVALVLADNLKKLGREYIVETANSGEEALIKVRDTKYSLVITDYRMAGMTGLDLAQEIRKVSSGTEVVLMTAYGTSELQETINRLELAAYVDKPFTMAQIRDVVRGVVERASREDPYRSGKRKVSDAFSKALVDLQTNTNARCVMLISSGGYPVDTSGHTEGLDLVSIAALTAGNFMASAELAKLLGTGSVFKSSYQEGPEYNIYSYDVNGDLLIAVIFGAESRPGVVWLYTKRTAAELAELADEEGEMTQASIAELSDSLDSQIDDIWNG